MSRGASFEPISKTDLRRLARIADEEREDLFARRPDLRLLYRRRLLCSALVGRSGLHFCNGSSGFEEFEMCLFFAAHAEAAFPHQWLSYRDFGTSKFGRAAGDSNYLGRRVSLIGRSLRCRPDAEPVAAVQRYLRGGRTPMARWLRAHAVVLIAPARFLGYVAWPSLVA